MWEKIKKFIERALPPGTPSRGILTFFLSGVLACQFYNMVVFWGRFFDKYWDLFIREDNVTLLSGELMTDFHLLHGGALRVHFIYAVISLALSIYLYSLYHQGSKSIYLMKRLPNSFERHRRALTLPIVLCALFIALATVSLLVNFGLYMLITPDECIKPLQWQKLWRSLL